MNATGKLSVLLVIVKLTKSFNGVIIHLGNEPVKVRTVKRKK